MGSLSKKGFEEVLYDAGKQIAVINQIQVNGFGGINREIWDSLVGGREIHFMISSMKI
jgi:hypothetical protein